MHLNITGQHVNITDALQEFVTTKFSKLEQFFDRINQIYIVMKVEKVKKIAEATIHLNNGELHATAEADDMYAAIDDLLIDKLTRQLNKHKEKPKQYSFNRSRKRYLNLTSAPYPYGNGPMSFKG